METNNIDFIVVGSGPSGAMAAETLITEGKKVLMIDVGIVQDTRYSDFPDMNFIDFRKAHTEQRNNLLGSDFECVELNDIKTGAQLTPQRRYLIKSVDKLIPVDSYNFFPMESLCYGGLGSGWGLGCYVYSENEISKTGLDVTEMRNAYKIISDRIGISASKDDDTSGFVLNDLTNVLPPLKMDNSLTKIHKKYLKKRRKLNKKGVFFGSPAMALLSKNFKERNGSRYFDNDFYTDRGLPAYRSWITIDALKKSENFKYENNRLAIRFEELNGKVKIKTIHTQTGDIKEYCCNKLILASGALGTARIVLRSFGSNVNKLPLLCNPYTYLPCINLRMLGNATEKFKTSMAQAVMFYDENHSREDVVSVAFYTYRSLLLYRIINQAPMNFSSALKIMQMLQSAFVIAGVHHPDEYSTQKYLSLKDNENSITKDALFINYELNTSEKSKIFNREGIIIKALRGLGCYAIKKINPGYGSSIHYAGTVPFDDKNGMISLFKNGRIRNTENVFVADGSGFNYLPAKGITLTLMANAHNVAVNSIK